MKNLITIFNYKKGDQFYRTETNILTELHVHKILSKIFDIGRIPLVFWVFFVKLFNIFAQNSSAPPPEKKNI